MATRRRYQQHGRADGGPWTTSAQDYGHFLYGGPVVGDPSGIVQLPPPVLAPRAPLRTRRRGPADMADSLGEPWQPTSRSIGAHCGPSGVGDDYLPGEAPLGGGLLPPLAPSQLQPRFAALAPPMAPPPMQNLSHPHPAMSALPPIAGSQAVGGGLFEAAALTRGREASHSLHHGAYPLTSLVGHSYQEVAGLAAPTAGAAHGVVSTLTPEAAAAIQGYGPGPGHDGGGGSYGAYAPNSLANAYAGAASPYLPPPPAYYQPVAPAYYQPTQRYA